MTKFYMNNEGERGAQQYYRFYVNKEINGKLGKDIYINDGSYEGLENDLQL